MWWFWCNGCEHWELLKIQVSGYSLSGNSTHSWRLNLTSLHHLNEDFGCNWIPCFGLLHRAQVWIQHCCITLDVEDLVCCWLLSVWECCTTMQLIEFSTAVSLQLLKIWIFVGCHKFIRELITLCDWIQHYCIAAPVEDLGFYWQCLRALHFSWLVLKWLSYSSWRLTLLLADFWENCK